MESIIETYLKGVESLLSVMNGLQYRVRLATHHPASLYFGCRNHESASQLARVQIYDDIDLCDLFATRARGQHHFSVDLLDELGKHPEKAGSTERLRSAWTKEVLAEMARKVDEISGSNNRLAASNARLAISAPAAHVFNDTTDRIRDSLIAYSTTIRRRTKILENGAYVEREVLKERMIPTIQACDRDELDRLTEVCRDVRGQKISDAGLHFEQPSLLR